MPCMYSVLMNILLFVIQCVNHTLTDEFVEDENHSCTADINQSDETEPAAEVKPAEEGNKGNNSIALKSYNYMS